MGVDIITFGCRLNTYESEVMRREANTAGLGALEHGGTATITVAADKLVFSYDPSKDS